MILNPYETTYGKVVYNKNDIDKVKDYVSSVGNELTYEFYGTSGYEQYVPAFILGKDSVEQGLPLFNQSIIYTTSHNSGWVIADLRKCISKNILRSDVTSIYNSGFITNRAGLDLEIIKTLIGCELANSRGLPEFKKSYNTIAMSFAILISNLLRIKLNYGPTELMGVRMACVYYILMLFGTSNNQDAFRKTVIERMMHINYGGGIVIDSRSKFNYLNNIAGSGDNINMLIEAINSMLKFVSYPASINSSILLQTLSEFFKGGPNGSENIMIGLEYMPNLMALLYSSFTEKTYKHTGLTKMFEPNTKFIQPTYLVNDIKYLMEKYTNI